MRTCWKGNKMFSRFRNHKDVALAEISEQKEWVEGSTNHQIGIAGLAERMHYLIASHIREISSLIAHDINNPLQVLLTKIQLSQIATPKTDDLKALEKETIRIVELVRALGQLGAITGSDELLQLRTVFSLIDQQFQLLLQKRELNFHYSTIEVNDVLLRKDLATFLILTIFLSGCKYLPRHSKINLVSSIQPDRVKIDLKVDINTIFYARSNARHFSTTQPLTPEMQLLADQIIGIDGIVEFQEKSAVFLLPV